MVASSRLNRSVVSAAALALLALSTGIVAAALQADTTRGLRLVHYCSPSGRCEQNHRALAAAGDALAPRLAPAEESFVAAQQLRLPLPATVLYRDSTAIAALTGPRARLLRWL